MVKILLQGQTEQKQSALYSQDMMGLTPLHTAAQFNHDDIAVFLVQEVSPEGRGVMRCRVSLKQVLLVLA